MTTKLRFSFSEFVPILYTHMAVFPLAKKKIYENVWIVFIHSGKTALYRLSCCRLYLLQLPSIENKVIHNMFPLFRKTPTAR